MSSSKFLSDSGWKDTAAKNKIKDNGLLNTLVAFKRVGEDKHDETLKVLEEALKLAGQLKKAKDVAAAPAAVKYLAELASAAEAAQRETIKAKAEATKKAETAAKAAAGKKDEADDDEDDESPEILTTKMLPLLRLVQKGQTMHTLMAKSGKQVVVMMSRKPIPPARRKLLADQLVENSSPISSAAAAPSTTPGFAASKRVRRRSC